MFLYFLRANCGTSSRDPDVPPLPDDPEQTESEDITDDEIQASFIFVFGLMVLGYQKNNRYLWHVSPKHLLSYNQDVPGNWYILVHYPILIFTHVVI